MELKNPLNYQEQIERLKTFHKLTINDEHEALTILQSINYYRLSGYGIGLTKFDNKDEYLENVSLKDLYDLYLFDSMLKSSLFHIIEQIEIGLRSKIAYCLAIRYGADGFYNIDNFTFKQNKSGKYIHSNIISKFNDEVNMNKHLPFVKHHIEKYDGKFPIWVAVELFSFGQLSYLYSIMKSKDKKSVAKQYECSPIDLESWIQCLVEIRNICAHYGRLYNLPLRHKPPLPSEYAQYQQTKQNKLFPVIVVLKLLLKSNNQWNEFFCFIKYLINKFNHVVNLSYNDFPSDWESILSSK